MKIHQKNKDGLTALDLARRNRHQNCVEIIREYKASKTCQVM